MRRFLVIVLNIGSVLLTVFYLLGCLTPYISPEKFWPMTFLALGFPLMAAFVIVMAIGWLFFDRRMSLFFLLLLFAGYKNLSSVLALNVPGTFQLQKDTTTLRVLSWNVKSFDNNAKHADHPDSARRKMINFVREVNADVLLLQEFVEYHNESIYSNIQVLRDTLGYKFFYFPTDLTLTPSYGKVESGSAIFSKFPLSDTLKFLYKGLTLPESAISSTLQFKNRKLRLITTHLVSMNIRKGAVIRDDEAFKRHDSAFIYGASTFSKLKFYDSLHSSQATALKQIIIKSIEPVIVSGDFNSIPSGYTYHVINKNLQDAFVEKGFGLGRTYPGLSPTLRIDYVLPDKRLKVLQYHCPRLYLSDHFPIVTDLQWR